MSSHRERDFFDDLAGPIQQANPAAPSPQPPQQPSREVHPRRPPAPAAADSVAAQENNAESATVRPAGPWPADVGAPSRPADYPGSAAPAPGGAALSTPPPADRLSPPSAWPAPAPRDAERPEQRGTGLRPPEPVREPVPGQHPPVWGGPSSAQPAPRGEQSGTAAATGQPRQRDSARADAHTSSPQLLREALRPSDLVAPPKPAPSRGWRKALYQLSFKKINVGRSADERQVFDLISGVGTNLRGTYTIAVLGGKGGAGKTVMTAAVGSMFKVHRPDPVVAIDADPAQAANLAARVDPKSASVREINADTQLLRYSDVRSYAGQNKAGLDVVASPRHSGGGASISAEEFAHAHTVLQRFYSVLLVDCGVNLEDPVMPEVLGRADAIVMVASAVPDGAVGANTNFEWLQQAGYQQLLSRMVLVINHIRGSTSRRERRGTRQLVETLVEHFGRWVAPERIFVMPYDPHIATAGIVELDALKPVTHRRILEVAASLASGFSATADKR